MQPILRLPTTILSVLLLASSAVSQLQQPMAAPTSSVVLSDVLPTQKQTSIFASFTRDIDAVSTRLETSSQNTTLLAPVNSAIQSLPRKPWEDPRDYVSLGTQAYDGKDGEDRAHKNLRRFVEAHVVPTSPWKEGEKVESLAGGKVWWESRAEGKRVVMPGEVEVENAGKACGNGEVWTLKGVLNYA